MLLPRVKELPEAGREAGNRAFLRDCGGSVVLQTPWSVPSSLQNWERPHARCCEPHGLWRCRSVLSTSHIVANLIFTATPW